MARPNGALPSKRSSSDPTGSTALEAYHDALETSSERSSNSEQQDDKLVLEQQCGSPLPPTPEEHEENEPLPFLFEMDEDKSILRNSSSEHSWRTMTDDKNDDGAVAAATNSSTSPTSMSLWGTNGGMSPSASSLSPGGSSPHYGMNRNGAAVMAAKPATVTTPWLSISPGLALKASPYAASSWMALALTLDGRDKLTKTLQYWSRLLAWALHGRPEAVRWAALKASLTNSRKAFRLGRSLMEAYKLQSCGVYARLQQAVDSTNTTAVPRPSGAAAADDDDAQKPLLTVLGAAGKLVGLLGFWLFDNVSYLSSSGFLDHYHHTKEQRLERRQRMVARASVLANRCYFGGSVAGLVANVQAYWQHRRQLQRALQNYKSEQPNRDSFCATQQVLQKLQEEQLTLVLAVVKSLCDMLVFSNNPGLDVWQRHCGHKLHEGLHCMLGLLSASTVLYNNFPAAASASK